MHNRRRVTLAMINNSRMHAACVFCYGSILDCTRAARIHGFLTAANDRCAITRCYIATACYSYHAALFDFANKIKSYEILRHFAHKTNDSFGNYIFERIKENLISYIYF